MTALLATVEVSIRPHKRRLEYQLNTRKRPDVYDLHVKDWFKGGKISLRDTQRAKCYAAEREARRLFPGQRTFKDLNEVGAYVRMVLESDWVQRRFPWMERITLQHRHNLRVGLGAWAEWKAYKITYHGTEITHGHITLSSWALGLEGSYGGEIILLHEIAHTLCPFHVHHHRQWVRTFIDLVSHFVSKQHGDILKSCFQKHKVKFNKPRIMSPEQRYAAAERLADARAAARKAKQYSLVPVLVPA